MSVEMSFNSKLRQVVGMSNIEEIDPKESSSEYEDNDSKVKTMTIRVKFCANLFVSIVSAQHAAHVREQKIDLSENDVHGQDSFELLVVV